MHLGAVPEAIGEKIGGIDDAALLKRLRREALKVSSLVEFQGLLEGGLQ
jgi:hypothetical protein